MPNPGYITPSRFKDVMTNGRGSGTFGATAITYAKEIALATRGIFLNEVTSKSLEWGKTQESHARARYELETFSIVPVVEQPLFHPKVHYISGTPDGLIMDDGVLEIKCPSNPLNHFDNLLDGKQYEQYKWQIQGYMWITGRKWCDFVSYDPRFPFDEQISINRILRDDDIIEQLADRCAVFWDELVKPLLKR